MLGFTNELPKEQRSSLRRVLEHAGVHDAKFVDLSESQIKEAAAGIIGEPLGISRP
jgi:hypothetical protein